MVQACSHVRNPAWGDTAWPVPEVPGEPTLWSVTWLPGRALTRDQAITAMTIAEAITQHPNTAHPASHRWHQFLQSWAAELGLTPSEAAKMAAILPVRDGGRRQSEPATHARYSGGGDS